VVATGDVNGDGVLDLVVTTVNDGVAVQLGNGDGTFQVEMTYVTRQSMFSSAMALADVSGDHALDIIVGDASNSGLYVLLNRGDGTFRDRVVYAAPEPQGLAVADLTGDGILDLVTVAPGSNLLSVFPGRGDGSFDTRINHLAGEDPVALLVLASQHLDALVIQIDEAPRSVSVVLEFVGHCRRAAEVAVMRAGNSSRNSSAPLGRAVPASARGVAAPRPSSTGSIARSR
jgi:VCBS repeat protein/FG-GAP repeat protein